MAYFDLIDYDDHEKVLFCRDKASGLKAIIAIHSTHLGPAVGGCRMWNYQNDEEALVDALRLSRGMTLKNAMAGLPFGGGKSVIIGDAKTDKSPELFRAFGAALESLGGRYISAEDVGITPQDIAIMAESTEYVVGRAEKSGDPSPFTAYGTFLGIKAAAKHKFGTDDLNGMRVAVQGVGHVGYYLCRSLHEAGADLVVTDINQASLDRVANEFAATVVAPDAIYDQTMQVYAPCALGATVNEQTLNRLSTDIIAGCANNQLATPSLDRHLKDEGILYAPDYVINAGGIINVSFENNYDKAKSLKQVEKIYQTLQTIFEMSEQKGKPTGEIANEMAQQKLSVAAPAKDAA